MGHRVELTLVVGKLDVLLVRILFRKKVSFQNAISKKKFKNVIT